MGLCFHVSAEYLVSEREAGVGHGVHCVNIQHTMCTPHAVGRARYGNKRQAGRVSLGLSRKLRAKAGTAQKSGDLRVSPLLGTSQWEYDMYGFIPFAISFLIQFSYLEALVCLRYTWLPVYNTTHQYHRIIE